MAEEQKSLEQTPTWAVATVCTVFVVASLLVERGINALGRYFKRTKQKELGHTLDQIKDELMLLGFISLFLTVFQTKVARLCMPERLDHIMLPCKYEAPVEAPAAAPAAAHRRRLLAEAASTTCSAGNVQIISTEGLHQLHMFIFVMAVVHVLYSCFTVLIGLWQVHSWKRWEVETRDDNKKTVDAAMQTNKNAGGNFIVSRINYKFLHTSYTGLNLDSYVYNFFRQFGRPIYKDDYLCLRLGFITGSTRLMTVVYSLPHGEFQLLTCNKLVPSFESWVDRKVRLPQLHPAFYGRRLQIGRWNQVNSAYLWGFVCIFLLLDVNGWYTYFWIAFIPTIMVLLVGMKLQEIITDLALEVRGGVQKIDLDGSKRETTEPVQELVCKPMKPRDDLFWFHSPRLLLYLVHFILFQNAFELAFFFWAMFTYGFSSCIIGRTWMIVVRLLMGAFVQILCSASTLPLYALVSQMGSKIKVTVFREATVSAIHGWHSKAKKKAVLKEKAHSDRSLEPDSPVKAPSHHLGIIGINKELDEHDHPVNIEHHHLNGAKSDHKHGVHQKDQQHKHPHHAQHQHPHSQSQDGFHTVEILEQSPAAPHDQDAVAPPSSTADPKSLAVVKKLLMAKKHTENTSTQKDGTP